MSSDVELRKIAQQLDQLNKNLFQMHRTLKEIAKRMDDNVGQDQIPKMVEEIAEVAPPKKPSEYDEMQKAIREHNDRRRYQNWEGE